MNCPQCKIELARVTEVIQVAQKNPGIGGYFGETAEEYGMSDQDRYATFESYRCPDCGYETLPKRCD